MSYTTPPSTSTIKNPRKPMGFFANAVKRKHSYIQFFAMTGIFLLSVRSLGQKYRLKNLQEDTEALKQEQEGLIKRMNGIKKSLLDEAHKESSGVFANRLRISARHVLQ
ncbi:hypothetical protein Leryth_003591 [Lithospermum erythrorhizon]|nr:hypothetical protein Leryth_003591 [Lithospermum erythrorhizon]